MRRVFCCCFPSAQRELAESRDDDGVEMMEPIQFIEGQLLIENVAAGAPRNAPRWGVYSGLDDRRKVLRKYLIRIVYDPSRSFPTPLSSMPDHHTHDEFRPPTAAESRELKETLVANLLNRHVYARKLRDGVHGVSELGMYRGRVSKVIDEISFELLTVESKVPDNSSNSSSPRRYILSNASDRLTLPFWSVARVFPPNVPAESFADELAARHRALTDKLERQFERERAALQRQIELEKSAIVAPVGVEEGGNQLALAEVEGEYEDEGGGGENRALNMGEGLLGVV
jgi:hypothetical protein